MYPNSKLLKIAELYYIERLSQSQIAAKLGISSATVSRMLNEALARGMIRVEIRDPKKRSDKLERALQERWKLDRVVVANGSVQMEDRYKILGKKTAELLSEFCRGKKTLGLGCGRTILETALSLDPDLSFPELRVIPLMGGWGVEEIEREANRLVALIGQRWGCKFQYLLLPAILSSPEILTLLWAEPQIRLTTNHWQHLDVALFSIGPELCASNAAYLPLSPEDIRKAHDLGTVGDILGRLVDEHSCELDLPFNHCLASISMDLLRQVPIRIGVGGGADKLKNIRASLESGLLSVLVTDLETAEYLTELPLRA
ncbi:MarR family transcriptional regulator [Fretibacterium sp. OH1220_COT-178]|nr:MarR family transcriptional regulator [Fretibacterium sp. OH1220_COT-178]